MVVTVKKSKWSEQSIQLNFVITNTIYVTIYLKGNHFNMLFNSINKMTFLKSCLLAHVITSFVDYIKEKNRIRILINLHKN